MSRVVNLRHEKADVRIDRRSRWGNPFRIGDSDLPWCGQTLKLTPDGLDLGPLDRDGVLYHFRLWAKDKLMREPDWLEPLRGKTLGCWCKPEPCHGDVILELLEGRSAIRMANRPEETATR